MPSYFDKGFGMPTPEQQKLEMEENERGRKHVRFLVILSISVALFVIVGLMYLVPAYSRYQARQDAANQIQVNHLIIQQEQQNIDVEKMKAEIRKQEAIGIAEAQKTINATLTPLYIQHEAIQAQEKMVNSPNHTEIYIPSGANGVPLVPMVQNLDQEHTNTPAKQ
jgi:hypothetical protein